MKKLKREAYFGIGLFALFAIFLVGNSVASQSGSSGDANLTVWTLGTSSGENRTICNSSYLCPKTNVDWDFYFYSNYTNSSGNVINSSDGNCNIRFNETGSFGSFISMQYNLSSFLWQHNQSFNYKGNLTYDINCTSAYGNITLNEIFNVKNTGPRETGLSFSTSAYEDSLITYDFSNNMTDDDFNDIPLSYSMENITSSNNNNTNSSFYSWIFINSTGMITFNATNNNQNGTEYTLVIRTSDGGAVPAFKDISATITAVNDAPNFTNLTDRYFNISTSSDPYTFEYLINITDEEDNIPFNLNISFLECSVANWSSRNCSTSDGRELFNSTQYDFNSTTGVLNISFSPQRNDVGNYTINFTVTDLNNDVLPYNASTSKVVYFNVLSRNTAPSFTYLCDNERNGTEDSEITCYINVTDFEEQNNVTYSANYSWFKFNDTVLNYSYGNVTSLANLTVNFSSYAIVNFTPGDESVGNWSINISLLDTGSYGDASKIYSQYINFTITNVDDNPALYTIGHLNGSDVLYTSNVYQISVNASDDDILIIDKAVYNESLNFTANVSWINFTTISVGDNSTNLTTAFMNIYPNSSLIGNHSVLINVSDRANLSSSQTIMIEINGNTAPVWGNMSSNITDLEDNRIDINLTANITDDEGNLINFSYVNLSYFPSFSFNLTTGIMNFTTNDLDVGRHIIIINASDGIAQSSLTFNFSIVNLNESPSILTTMYGVNVTLNGLRINTTEDTPARIYLLVDDEDLKILQKAYYNESLSITTTVVKNDSLSNLFTFTSYQYPYISNNRTQYIATFTANKSDVGNYTVTVNVTDISGLNSSLSFNLSIAEVPHPPTLYFPQSLNYSIYERFYLDVNSSDLEDGEEYLGLNNTNFTYSIENLTAGGNFLAINESTGIITNLSGASNFSLNQSQDYAGSWTFNVTVRDTTGLNSSQIFNLRVYDYPQIFSPASSYIFNLTENLTSSINFTVNHSVLDNLNYSIYIRGNIKASGVSYGNNSMVYLNITPNWTDETGDCAGSATLVLNVSNQKLSNSTSWNLNIAHVNYPIRRVKDISVGGSINITGTSPIILYLNEYFEDIDVTDACHNQTIGFKQIFISSNDSNESTITVGINNWTNMSTPSINFSSAVNATSFYYLNVSELNESNSSDILNIVQSTNRSNTFIITIIESSAVVEVPTTGSSSSSGSSGGGTTEVPVEANPILLKLLLPDPVSIDSQGKIILPISLINGGVIDLRELTLYSVVSINGSIAKNVSASFDRDYLAILSRDTSENFTLTVDVDTELEGLYEITVNVSVKNPEYFDWGKIYMNVKKGTSIKEKFVFISELMVSNPECSEIKELVDRAKESLDKGDFELAVGQLDEAINACRQAIAQKPNPRSRSFTEERLLNYVSLATIAFFIIGIAYYLYRRGRFMQEVNFDADLTEN